jgi:flagellar biosynthesis protein FlhF
VAPRAAAREPDAAPRRRWTRGFAPLAQAGTRFGLSPAVLDAVEQALLGSRVRLERAGDPAAAGLAARVLQALVRTTAMTLPDWRVVAFVGPTGAGKTTTLAKLAALAARDAGERLALVTLDTYRVAAVEQLRAYAEMLAVPLEVAFTPMDLRAALQKHRDADRVLIDTGGRGPFDRGALDALAGSLRPARARLALCLPASARRDDATLALEAFARGEPDAVVLTKWDETRTPGETLALAIELGLPLSHVAVGQQVPEDIVRADGGALAAAAFGLELDVLEAR